MAHNGSGEPRPAHSAPAFRHSDVLLKLNLGSPKTPRPASTAKPASAALYEGQASIPLAHYFRTHFTSRSYNSDYCPGLPSLRSKLKSSPRVGGNEFLHSVPPSARGSLRLRD
ncbi:hypothetical protein MRX96_024980 [Rhipicephalus microplus]